MELAVNPGGVVGAVQLLPPLVVKRYWPAALMVMAWLASPPSRRGAKVGGPASPIHVPPPSPETRQLPSASPVEKNVPPPARPTGLRGTIDAAPAASRLMMLGAAHATAVPTAKPP